MNALVIYWVTAPAYRDHDASNHQHNVNANDGNYDNDYHGQSIPSLRVPLTLLSLGAVLSEGPSATASPVSPRDPLAAVVQVQRSDGLGVGGDEKKKREKKWFGGWRWGRRETHDHNILPSPVVASRSKERGWGKWKEWMNGQKKGVSTGGGSEVLTRAPTRLSSVRLGTRQSFVVPLSEGITVASMDEKANEAVLSSLPPSPMTSMPLITLPAAPLTSRASSTSLYPPSSSPSIMLRPSLSLDLGEGSSTGGSRSGSSVDLRSIAGVKRTLKRKRGEGRKVVQDQCLGVQQQEQTRLPTWSENSLSRSRRSRPTTHGPNALTRSWSWDDRDAFIGSEEGDVECGSRSAVASTLGMEWRTKGSEGGVVRTRTRIGSTGERGLRHMRMRNWKSASILDVVNSAFGKESPVSLELVLSFPV